MLAQACEKRGRKAGDDRKVEAVEKKFHSRGTGEQVIKSMCIMHQKSLIAVRHHRLEIIKLFRGVLQSICILMIAGWRHRQGESRPS